MAKNKKFIKYTPNIYIPQVVADSIASLTEG